MTIFKFRNLNTGQAMPIPPGEYTIGREDDVHIHVEDPSVSRYHAKVFNLDDGFYLEDNGSSNGTATQGAYITGRTQINFGDVVHIGSVPFRVDPEVTGEPEEAPATGMRPARAAYMRRDTERIPAMGEASRVVPVIEPDKLAAPEVNADDVDAEDLNAITMREPVAEVPVKRLPTVRPGLSAAQVETDGQVVPPKSTPESFIPPHAQPEATIPPPPVVPVSSPKPVVPSSVQDASRPTKPPPTSAAPASTTTSPSLGFKARTLLIVFLAGMGAGLLLGLFFAKLFYEMGGKAVVHP